MEKSFLLRRVIWLAVAAGLLFPVLHLLLFIPTSRPEWDPFLLNVIFGAGIQTLLSLVFTFLIGLPAGFGLIGLKVRLSSLVFRCLCVVILTPGFVPPLLLVLLGSRGLGFFPTGLFGVVYFHILMNLGLFSFIFFKLVQKKAPSWIDHAVVSGVKPLRFVLKGLLPELRQDLAVLALFYFILYFFSFTVPFLVGGSLYGGVEVFIYEKVLFFGQWGQALYYSLVLFLFLFSLSYWLRAERQEYGVSEEREDSNLDYLSVMIFSPLSLLPVLLILYGLLSVTFALWLHSGVSVWTPEARGTLLVGVSTGLFILIFLFLTSFAFLRRSYSRFLLSFTHPGWVVVGFSFLLLPGEGVVLSFIKLSMALSLLYFPFVYRLGLEPAMKDLATQIDASENFPVSWSKTYFQILFPQMLPSMALMSGLGALWACGDFALTGILLDPSRSNTLAYEMKNLVTSYRLDQALLLVGPLMFYSLLVFALFQGFAYVSRKKI